MDDGRARTTIFVLCFNYARYLADAVESALAQDDEHGVRVVVVDDGSTDDTPDVAASFGDRITYYRKPNGGLSNTRNYAAARCSTEYLLYLDADNCLPPEFVRTCRDALEAAPDADFAFTQLRYFGDRTGSSAFPAYDPARLRRGNSIDACALLRSATVQEFGYDTALRDGLEDWDFYLTLAERGHRGVLVDGTFVGFRVHGDSMGDAVQRDRRRRQWTYARILWKHRRFLGMGAVLGMVERSARYRLARRPRAG